MSSANSISAPSSCPRRIAVIGGGISGLAAAHHVHEIDPANELYKEPPVNSLETIGPRESRRLAAGASFDPAAENWLNAPMDFENEVLANELRQGLMQKAGLAEEDLAPNPMPALRHIEMFTVA